MSAKVLELKPRKKLRPEQLREITKEQVVQMIRQVFTPEDRKRIGKEMNKG